MATMINERCVNCGACESVCPGGAIHPGSGRYVIDPTICTECVGYHARAQCQLICPVDNCCVLDPLRIETEEILFERALEHSTAGAKARPVLTGATSRFRVDSLPWWRRLMLNV
jgi:ferredoxin